MTSKSSLGLIIFLICFLGNQICFASEYRSFHSSTNQKIIAKFENLDGQIVTLRREDQKVFQISINKLSTEDQKWINHFAAKTSETAKRINQATGLNWTSGKFFSELRAEEIAKAFGLPLESRAKNHLSWRLYASFEKGYTLFGAMPYSVALYADREKKLESISIVFANKGDYGSTAGFATDHFQSKGIPEPSSLDTAMNYDEETVSKAINSILGESSKQRFGEGKSRRNVQRWDWNGHAFLLCKQENEYVSLSVVSTEMADSKGKTDKVDDNTMKQQLMETVLRKENGDVIISEIPMVNQGPKGYCAPATFERLMRTMGIQADMYLLAMVGETQAGGGTSVGHLLENIKSSIYNKGRRTKELEVDPLKISDFKKYIDQGIPVMWTMCSIADYNHLADENTKGRRDENDKEFRKIMDSKVSRIRLSPKPEDNYHICMIIGYNEKTGEIAVSDSWGEAFAERWVPLPVADWASLGKLFMVLP